MNKSLHELSKLYTAALQNYLTAEGEEALHLAYELGRKAIADGLGVLDIAQIHQEASIASLLPMLELAQNQPQLQAVETFFMETLSPFEAHHRGFREANVSLRELNETLEHRAAELAATNRELSHEISRRKASEEMWKRYESIVNTSREFLTLIGSNYRYEAVNDAYCRAHLKAREEILNSTVAEIWGEKAFRNIIKGYLDQCFKGEEVHYENWFEMAALGRRFFEVSYYPYHEKTVVTHAIVVTRDVTDRWQAERAVRESEEQFRTLMQSATDAIILAGRDGNMIACNQAAREMFGRTSDEVIGQPLTQLMPDRYRRAHEVGIQRACQGDGAERLIGRTTELCGLRKDGAEFPLELSLASWETERGPLYCGIIRDITERKRSEEEIRLLQTIALSVSGAEDLNAALGAVVSKVCETTGWVFGQAWVPRPDSSALECSSAWHGSCSGLKEFRRASERSTFLPGVMLPGLSWSAKQPIWNSDVTSETNFSRARSAKGAGLKAGMAIPIMAEDQVVAVIEFFGREPRQEDERLIKLVSAVANQVGMVIQRKRIQEQFDRFFTLSGDLLCVAGFDGYLKRVNPAWKHILGHKPEKLLAIPYTDWIHPDQRATAQAEFDRLKAGATIVSFEVRARCNDGSYRWTQWTATPAPNENIFYAIGRDFTQRKQAEEALRESEEHYRELFNEAKAMQEKLRELSSKVLHAQEEERKRISRELHDEVGQALTAISVNLQLLKQKAAKAGKGLDAAVAETQSLLEQTMHNVHRFSYELRPAMLDDLGLIIALRWYIKSFAKRTGIKLNFRADAVVEQLEGEPKTVIYRVVQESLTNVYKYADAIRVQVIIKRMDDTIRLTVRDNGKGFRPDQLDLSSKDHSGMGLMGMQERLRLVNGQFSVESQEGKGTTIRATVPLRTESRQLHSTDQP